MNLIRTILASLLILTGCGPQLLARTEPRPDQPHIRVLTFNVNYGSQGDPENLRVIAQSGADLVFLQEITPAFEYAARARLSDLYPYMDFHQCCTAGGLAVLSRLPFQTRSLLPSPLGWFPSWIVTAQTPIGPVQILQVHLHPPVTEDGSWVLGYLTTDSLRLREMTEYLAHLDPNLPTLVLGDFNETRGDATRLLEARGFTDGLPRFSPRTPTWRWQTSIGPLQLVLDHIMYSKALIPLSLQVLDQGNSDHLPVLGVFIPAPVVPAL